MSEQYNSYRGRAEYLQKEIDKINSSLINISMPIRLLPMSTTNSRVLPFMLIQFVIGWSRYLAANAKQGAKSIIGVESPVKSECKLIQVGL